MKTKKQTAIVAEALDRLDELTSKQNDFILGLADYGKRPLTNSERAKLKHIAEMLAHENPRDKIHEVSFDPEDLDYTSDDSGDYFYD